eukprot:2626947-Prymnesium_polylepis.2
MSAALSLQKTATSSSAVWSPSRWTCSATRTRVDTNPRRSRREQRASLPVMTRIPGAPITRINASAAPQMTSGVSSFAAMPPHMNVSRCREESAACRGRSR